MSKPGAELPEVTRPNDGLTPTSRSIALLYSAPPGTFRCVLYQDEPSFWTRVRETVRGLIQRAQ